MEGGIFAIYGSFGDGKTLGAVVLILQKLKKGDIVFSNIKLDKKYIPNPDNYYYFESMADFYDILAMSGLFAMKLSQFSTEQVKIGLPPYPRGQRPNINIFFDETGIFANSKDFREIHKEYGKDLQQYILQMRKLYVTTYLIIQKPKQLVSDLRIHVAGWLKFRPLFGWDIMQKYAGSYYLQILDPETFKVATVTHSKYDSNGDMYNYDVPEEVRAFRVWYKPFYYKYYDDLFLNKVFETQFKGDFLYTSGFFGNLKQGNIKNKTLTTNSHIYANYFDDVDNTDQAFIPPKVPFSSNPNYWLYLRISLIKRFFTRKYYLKNLFTKRKKGFDEIAESVGGVKSE